MISNANARPIEYGYNRLPTVWHTTKKSKAESLAFCMFALAFNYLLPFLSLSDLRLINGLIIGLLPP